MSIPAWNALGVIDPIDLDSPHSPERSPYRVSLPDFVGTFGTSMVRVEILRGLLSYRSALRTVGVVSGLQWIDGSFLENIEVLENRSPGDVDVVTFYDVPVGETQMSLRAKAPELFPIDAAGQRALKDRFKVDGYMQQLATPPVRLVGRAAYWYSLWSHRRDLSWKGFVEVDLVDDDAEALVRLNALSSSFSQGSSQVTNSAWSSRVARGV